MGKFKIAVSFDPKFLNTLKDTDKSGVEIQRSKHHLALHPIHLNNFSKSIRELLNDGVAKYDKELEGLLLGYENINLLREGGTIHDDSCYIHLDIEADFFVFKPKVGEEMQGVVTRKTKDHVGLLVYNTFNVSIPGSYDQENWLGQCVKIGYEVLFKIVHFSFNSYLPYIKGELIAILSQVDSGVSSEGSKHNNAKKKSNKILVFGDDDGDELDQNENFPEVSESPKKKKSKKDKRKSMESGLEISVSELVQVKSVDNDSFVSTGKKKKKVKLESTVTVRTSSDLDTSLNEKKSKKKKRKNSETEPTETPTKKKRRTQSSSE